MKTTNNKQHMILTPNSQPELITQDTPQLSPRVSKLKDLIEEMDTEKKLMRGKHQQFPMKTRTNTSKKQQNNLPVNRHQKQEPAQGSRELIRPYRKGTNNHEQFLYRTHHKEKKYV